MKMGNNLRGSTVGGAAPVDMEQRMSEFGQLMTGMQKIAFPGENQKTPQGGPGEGLNVLKGAQLEEYAQMNFLHN